MLIAVKCFVSAYSAPTQCGGSHDALFGRWTMQLKQRGIITCIRKDDIDVARLQEMHLDDACRVT